MNRNLERAFAEQATRLFAMCKAYIGIDEAMPTEAKEALKEEIAAAWEALDVDFNRLFEEIIGNLEEPMSEQQRERYCFSLITPFKEYSSVLYPYWEIAKYKESLTRAQSEDNVNLAELYRNLIAAAEARAERYKEMAFAGKYKPIDEAEEVYRKLAQRIGDYGRILDAAFVLSGLDLKRLQDRCAVSINSFTFPDRAKQIGEIIGSEALANEYLAKLQQEPQEQPQDATNTDTLAGVAPEPQHIPTINDTDKERLVFGKALKKQYMNLENGKYKWHKSKSLLAYMCGRLYCGDKVIEDDSDYSSTLVKGNKQMPKNDLQELFGVDVASNRYSLKEPPRNYEIIDDLFKSDSKASR